MPPQHERPFQLSDQPHEPSLLMAEGPKIYNSILLNVKADQILPCLGALQRIHKMSGSQLSQQVEFPMKNILICKKLQIKIMLLVSSISESHKEGLSPFSKSWEARAFARHNAAIILKAAVQVRFPFYCLFLSAPSSSRIQA